MYIEPKKKCFIIPIRIKFNIINDINAVTENKF